MDNPELPPPEQAGEQPFVRATYREIAIRFGLSGPDAARIKAKRAGWQVEAPNHPADPRHVRIPRSSWEQPPLAPVGAGRPERPALNPPPAKRARSPEVNPEQLADARVLLARLEGELAGLRTAMTERGERAERAEKRAEQAEQGRERAETRERTLIAQLARLEAEQAAFGASLSVTHARAERVEAAEQRERAVIAELAAVRAELDALAARPWWRRLFRRG